MTPILKDPTEDECFELVQPQIKRFWKLKRGEQFSSGDGWDLLKTGMFTARAAHARFDETIIRWPWQKVCTIDPNPNCTSSCPCKEFEPHPPADAQGD